MGALNWFCCCLNEKMFGKRRYVRLCPHYIEKLSKAPHCDPAPPQNTYTHINLHYKFYFATLLFRVTNNLSYLWNIVSKLLEKNDMVKIWNHYNRSVITTENLIIEIFLGFLITFCLFDITHWLKNIDKCKTFPVRCLHVGANQRYKNQHANLFWYIIVIY